MLGRRKAQELTDDQMIDWLASQVRVLKIVVLALIVGLLGGALYIISNNQYLAERAKFRNEEARLQSCAVIYDGSETNPYIEELERRHTDCAERAKKDGRPSARVSPAKPKPSAASGAPSTQVPSRVPSPGAVGAPSARSAAPTVRVAPSVARTPRSAPASTATQTTKGTPTPRPTSPRVLLQLPCINALGIKILCPVATSP